MKIFLYLIAICALALAVPADTDVSGKWTGTLTNTGGDNPGESSPALLILKQAGGELTGTAGPDEGQQFPVKKGTVSGSKVTFEIEHENQTIKVELVLAGEKMTGDITMSRDGQNRTGKLELARAK